MSAAEFGDPRLPARFWAKVRVDAETCCWLWTASRSVGYGKFSVDGRSRPAHRVAYAALVSELPPYAPGDLQLDHLCRNRACVNPAHLELVSQRVNLLRGDTVVADHANRTHCPQGHSLEGANLVRSQLRRGRRECLTCCRAGASALHVITHDAQVSLGLTVHDYRAMFGRSRTTAERIIAAIESGITPESIVASARVIA